jgi:hypothetical protein
MQQRTVVLCLFALASAGCADAPVSPKAVCTTQGLDWAIGKPADEATSSSCAPTAAPACGAS